MNINLTSDAPPGDTPLYVWKQPWLERGLIVLFWTLIAALTIGRRAIDPRGPGEGIHTGETIQILLEYGLWAFITPLIFWFSHRFGLVRPFVLRRLFLHVAVSIVIAAGFDLFGLTTYHIFVTGQETTKTFQSSLLTLTFLDEWIIYLTVLAAGFARDYFMQYQERRDEALQLRTQATELQAQLAEARLKTLRMQINPHFLFNTLNAVSALVERDPRGVRRMISLLSGLLRHSLEESGNQEVTVQEELEFLERYLEIQRIRFQGRLEVVEEVDSDVLEALIPSMILQPLVENAVIHGVSKLEKGGQIQIKAWRDADDLCLRICDNGPGLTMHLEKEGRREGVGLRNIRERLQSLYAEEQSLTLLPAEPNGLCAEIHLPYSTRYAYDTVVPVN